MKERTAAGNNTEKQDRPAGRELEHEHEHKHGHEHEHVHEHEHKHVHEHEHEHEHEHGDEGPVGLRVARLAAGAIVFAAAFVLKRFEILSEAAVFWFYAAAYLILGFDVVFRAVRNLFHGELFDENFLMTVSTLGAFAIGEVPEAVAVMLLYQIGELLQDVAVDRSRDSIEDLMDIRPDAATVLRGSEWVRVNPEEVEVGERVLVRPGERIPLDGIVIDGEASVDMSALSGESVPVSLTVGSAALSGSVATDGVLTIEAEKKAGESTASKILELIENASSKKAPAERFITKFARIYTPVVCAIALLIALVPPLAFGQSWTEWIRRGCVTLAVSCPCALVISVPLTFFGGIGTASRRGILVKGSAHLETLAGIDAAVFDKTGTLTKGTFAVREIEPEPGFDRDSVLMWAALAEVHSTHPAAKSIVEAYVKEIDTEEITSCRETAGQGAEAVWRGHTILAGNARLLENHGIPVSEDTSAGTAVFVAVDGRYAGVIRIADEVRPDAAEAIRELKQLGVKRLVMLTGDRAAAANAVAREIGLDERYSGLLPGDKVEKLEEIISAGSKTVFVGDGINDAPVLARADVGVAMGGLGSDAAIEAADVVLMRDEPSKLAEAVRVAKKTRRIVKQNIVFAVAVKAVCIALGALGLIGMWVAVFGDVGVMLLAVLNALRVTGGEEKRSNR